MQPARPTAARLAAALVLLAPPAARAHHAITESAVTVAEPATYAAVEVEVGRFDTQGRTGTYVTVAPSLEIAWRGILSAGARVPLARVAPDGGPPETGLGDVELLLRGRLFATHHGGLILSAGLTAEAPTGDEARGLGGGHWDLGPFVSAASNPVSWLALFATVTEHVSVGGGAPPAGARAQAHYVAGMGRPRPAAAARDAAARARHANDGSHGAPYGPHSDHELSIDAGAAYLFGEAGYAAARATAVVLWEGGARLGPVTPAVEVGWLPAEALRLKLALAVPLAPRGVARRADWRITLGGSYRFALF